MSDLQTTIEQAWDGRDKINLETRGAVREAVNAALDLLDSGKARVAEKVNGDWVVNQWLKKAVLLELLTPHGVGTRISRTGPFSCRASSISAPMSTPVPWSIPG